MEITGKNESIEKEKHEIVKLFPTLDLTEVFVEYSHLSSEALIGLILAKQDQIPNKPGICARFVLKACSFAIGLADRLPRWLGGRLLGSVFLTIETNVASVMAPKDMAKGAISLLRESMECSVCLDSAPVNELCFCDPVSSQDDNNKPKAHRRLMSETHAFCRNCLEHHAHAAIGEMPLAKGGLGLRCMASDCDNPITFQEIRTFISSELAQKLEERSAELSVTQAGLKYMESLEEIRTFISSELAQKLEERSAELSVTQAGLKYMERCRGCNCAVELGVAPAVQQVFRCPDCKNQFCRLCDEPWQREHANISCEDFAKQQNRERLLEKRLNEVVVHKCPKCKLAFVKHDGCNKITCRCGTTQCYICREENVNYDHFCRCFHERRRLSAPFKCAKCAKNCLLWESSISLEKREMERIRHETKKEEERKNGRNGPSSKNTAPVVGKKISKEGGGEKKVQSKPSRIPLMGRILNR